MSDYFTYSTFFAFWPDEKRHPVRPATYKWRVHATPATYKWRVHATPATYKWRVHATQQFQLREKLSTTLIQRRTEIIVSFLTYRAFCPWHQLQHDKVIYEMKLKYR